MKNLFKRSPNKGKQLTVAEYLEHMSVAVHMASVAGPAFLTEVLKENALDTEIPLGDQKIPVDTASLMPSGWFDLDEFNIECESAVELAKDKEGNVEGLAMTMNRGLLKNGMNVKFKATFKRGGTLEAVEILRDAGNQLLREAITGRKTSTNFSK